MHLRPALCAGVRYLFPDELLGPYQGSLGPCGVSSDFAKDDDDPLPTYPAVFLHEPPALLPYLFVGRVRSGGPLGASSEAVEDRLAVAEDPHWRDGPPQDLEDRRQLALVDRLVVLRPFQRPEHCMLHLVPTVELHERPATSS
eukprot:2460455-Pyramimonas_sp.AAC.1